MTSRLPAFLILLTICALVSQSYSQGSYNFYFGDIHSHTWYSDGNQDQNQATYTKPVARAITYARTVATNMNYLGISDHNHNESLNMTMAYWRSGHREADSVNMDGTFVGLYGQEWGTIGTGGHILIYGTDKLFGWNPGLYDVFVAKGDYTALYDSVRKYGGFMYLAHPNQSDFDGIFTGAYNANWDSVVQGTAMKSGPAFSTSTTENDPDNGNYVDRYNDLLKKGYHVAPIANQDNHNTNFGMSNQQRTVILAASLSKADVVDALRNRRAYASEDHNLKVEFEIGTHRMGELFTMSGSVPIRIKAIDAGETISRIEIRYGIPGSGSAPTTLTFVTGRDSLVYTQAQPNNTTYYYYAYVQEADGQQAWSAPMWVTTSAAAPPSAFSQTSPTNLAANQPVAGSLTWQTASGATGYDVYFDANNPPTTLVSSNQAGTSYAYSGLTNNANYYWKIVARNANGTTDATGSPWRFTTIVAAPAAFAQLSPSSGATNQPVSGTLSWQASTNATQYDVYLDTVASPSVLVSSNQAGTSYSYSGLQNNRTYYWRVVAENVAGSLNATGSPWSFTTIMAPPSAFTSITPVSGAPAVPVSGTLTWQASPNATGYDVYFDTVTPPVQLVSSNQPGTSHPYAALTNSTTYYWKVVARNTVGTLDGTGSPWNFTTVMPAPALFSQSVPVDSAIDQTIAGTLTWQTSTNATAYDVYLDTVSPPVALVSANQPGTSYAYSGLHFTTTYFWKVVAKNNGGTLDASGSPWRFTTMESNLPGPYTLLSPPSGSTGQLLAGQLVWNASATAASYDVYIGTSPVPVSWTATNLTDTSYLYSGLLPSTTYYWTVLAYNVNGSTEPTGVPFSFVTLGYPAAPTNLTASALTPASVQLTWSDVAVNEDGYRIYRSPVVGGPFTKVSQDMAAGTEAFTDTGLQVNQLYYYRVAPYNVVGEENVAEVTVSTLARIPNAPSIADAGYQTLRVVLDSSLNPSATEYAIQVSDSAGVSYVQSDGFPGGSPAWGTYAAWGSSGGTLVRGLTTCHPYGMSVLARNADGIATVPGDATPGVTACYAVTYNVTDGWNLVSVPIDAEDHSVAALFPTAGSRPFGFANGYLAADSLASGAGYWLKFDAPVPVSFAGSPRLMDTIQVHQGWNMIGAPAVAVDVDAILQQPVGIVASAYFGYANGYAIADSLRPVQGYWVKAIAGGSLILGATAIPSRAGMMTPASGGDEGLMMLDFRDARGRIQSLYIDTRSAGADRELPPVPPADAFDVRFGTQFQGVHLNGGSRAGVQWPVGIHGAVYPVTVTLRAGADRLSAAIRMGENLVPMTAGQYVTIGGPQSGDISVEVKEQSVIPVAYALEQNYPNPFNPSTVIGYSLPVSGYVTLKIYSVLGQEVATLVAEESDAGRHLVQFDASQLPSGVYYYRMVAGAFAETRKLMIVK